MGIEGAALGSAAVMFAYNLIKYGYLKWRLNLDPFSLETLKILVVGIITLAALYLSPALTNPFLSILTTSLLVIAVFVGSSALLGVGKEEWAWLKNRGK